VKFAYADPPYLGQGKKLYGKHHDEAHVWDDPQTHQELIDRLVDEFPDGWAMSASSGSLRTLLPMCPDDVRVASWVKPFAIFKPNVGLAYAWEPVILRGGRKIPRDQKTVRDWVAENITLKKGLTGAKPPRFCEWVFSMLNAQPGDELVDIFPGTGVVGETWRQWITRNDYLPEVGGIAKPTKAVKTVA
jgi:hypothetical protein